ncbi:CYP4V2 [Cordylochernes scorpioides]|uniref:CYP4V2 n=1 Tax=Cordylochernes scorpioides TaxID=51811 RepID=A0ABY6L9H2_9ARAC|nr:CYP4V2 [Cordylochernes scorpioides]
MSHTCAQALLTNPTLIEKSFEYSFLKPWLREGLITSAGSRWKSHRKMITPSFHFRILEDFVPVFNEQSRVLASKLDATNGSKVDILPYMSLCSLDIICGKFVTLSDAKTKRYLLTVSAK